MDAEVDKKVHFRTETLKTGVDCTMRHSLSSLIGAILLVAAVSLCALAQSESELQTGVVCVQGKVFYRSPVDAGLVPYPEVTVSAWRHGTEEGLGETKTGADGAYRIDLPVQRDGRVDLRVWGAQRIGGTGFHCRGAAEDVSFGGVPPKSESGCIEVDIVTECDDRLPHRFR